MEDLNNTVMTLASYITLIDWAIRILLKLLPKVKKQKSSKKKRKRRK